MYTDRFVPIVQGLNYSSLQQFLCKIFEKITDKNLIESPLASTTF